jgi:uncharacterized protein YqeY
MDNRIENQIPIDLKNAMLAKDKVKLEALRAVKSVFLLEKTNELAQQLISKLHKQRMDAYKIYVEQKREDLASVEFSQAKVLEIYLPKQLNVDELTKELQKIIDSLGATSMSDIGKVMGKAMAILKGKAEGSLISKIIKDLLR